MPKNIYIPKELRKPFQKSDGRFVKGIILPNKKYKYITASTEKEFKIKCKEYEKAIDTGVIYDDKTTVEQWGKTWFSSYKSSLSENAKIVYHNTVNVHIMPVIGSLYLKDVKPIHLLQIMNKITNSSESLQGKVLMTLKQIFNTAVENKLIMSSPCVGIKISPIQKQVKLKALSEVQQDIILKASKDTSGELFVALGLFCGLRREESLALTWNDIQDGIININKSVTFSHNQPILSINLKTSAAHRQIPIPPPLADLLSLSPRVSLYLCHNTKGELMSETSYKRMWQGIENKINFECTSHMLRHTYCTMLHKAGIDLRMAQYLMGHSDIKMTAKIYTHIENLQIQNAALKISNIFSSDKNRTNLEIKS